MSALRPLRRLAALLVALTVAVGVCAASAAAATPQRVVALTPFTANTLASLGV